MLSSQEEHAMADYAEGDEQLQDAFEEGNGDAAHDEVSHRCILHPPCFDNV